MPKDNFGGTYSTTTLTSGYGTGLTTKQKNAVNIIQTPFIDIGTTWGAGAVGTGAGNKAYRQTDAITGLIITEVHIDMDGLVVKGTTLGDAIGVLGNPAYVYQNDVANNGANITNADLNTYDTQYKANVAELRELISRITVLEGIYFGDSAALKPLAYGASTFHASMHCEGCSNEFASHRDSYIVDCDYIKTSFESGKICLSYMAFPTDADCFPLVPDDISYKEAMFWYIFKQLLLGGYDKPTNRIDYNFADQKWRYYCTQARNAANYPDIDKYESYMNQWVRLVPDVNAHELFFENLNERETLYRG